MRRKEATTWKHVGMQKGANFTIVGTMLTETSQSIMYVTAPLVIQATSL